MQTLKSRLAERLNPFMTHVLMLLLGMLLTLPSTHHTSSPIATYQPDTSRVIIIREIYAVDKEIDSIYNIYSDSIGSPNTTEALLSILRLHDKGDKPKVN